jgi:hypothetical protein
MPRRPSPDRPRRKRELTAAMSLDGCVLDERLATGAIDE